MTLCKFLDDVRCGNVGRLCVAICGEDDYLDNFREGKYWELEEGNWHAGSASPATPDLPEEILDAEVMQIECDPNVTEIFANLDDLHHNNWHFTIVLVEEPDDFDAEEYWTEDNMNDPITYVEWPYSISQELYNEIDELVPNMAYRRMALRNLLNIGINTAANLTDDEIDAQRIDETKLEKNQIITVRPDEILRATRAIAQKLADCDLSEIMALLDLEGMGSVFNKYF